MFTLDEKIYQNTIVIKNSEFITIAARINNKDELNQFLSAYSKIDATHNCYGYKFGVQNQSAGFSDDGEPGGTAGKPILNVIEKMNLTNIVVIVIRYYGGKKLGAGPLTRAYTTSASELLNSLELHKLIEAYEYSFDFEISDTKVVDAFLRANSVQNIIKTYNDRPNYTFIANNPVLFENSNVPILNLNIKKTMITN